MRWGHLIAAAVFGGDYATPVAAKAALTAVSLLAGRELDETDTELGTNLIIFLLRYWPELVGAPNLGQMIPDLATVSRVQSLRASRHRVFSYYEPGAIQADFVFVAMLDALKDLPAEICTDSPEWLTCCPAGDSCIGERGTMNLPASSRFA